MTRQQLSTGFILVAVLGILGNAPSVAQPPQSTQSTQSTQSAQSTNTVKFDQLKFQFVKVVATMKDAESRSLQAALDREKSVSDAKNIEAQLRASCKGIVEGLEKLEPICNEVKTTSAVPPPPPSHTPAATPSK